MVAASNSDTVEVFNPEGAGDIVLVCEHASNQIPPELGDLGLSADLIESHIAWDPGALSVARGMAEVLDATLLSPRYSRLVYDCNRPPESDDAMPTRSEIFDVPGNRDIDAAERRRRTEIYYRPFVDAVGAELDRRIRHGRAPALVTVHSFTPVYKGRARDVEIGILHDADRRYADALLAALSADIDAAGLDIRRNEPYGPADGVTHTLAIQAAPRGLLNAMVEIRNDLLRDRAACDGMAACLARAVKAALGDPMPLRRAEEHAS